MTVIKQNRVILSSIVGVVSAIVFIINPSIGLYFISFTFALIAYLFITKSKLIQLGICTIIYVGTWLSLVDYAAESQANIVLNRIRSYLQEHKKTPKTIDELFTIKTMARTPTFNSFIYSSEYDSLAYDDFRIEYKDFWGNNVWHCPMDDEWEIRNR